MTTPYQKKQQRFAVANAHAEIPYELGELQVLIHTCNSIGMTVLANKLGRIHARLVMHTDNLRSFAKPR